MLEGDVREQLLGFAPIALERHQHGHFVPDVGESLVVIGDRIAEHLAVRNVNDPPARLVRVHPRPELVERELEQAQVDHVPRVRPDLDAVAHLEGTPPDDERPPREVRHWLLECDREPCSQQAKEGREGLHAREPHAADDDGTDRHHQVRQTFAPAVAAPRVAHPAVHIPQHDPPNEPQADNRRDRGQQPRLELGVHSEMRLQPVDHASAW